MEIKQIIPPGERDILQPRRSRLFAGGPVIEFVTVQVPTVALQVAADIFVQFQQPHRLIFIASIQDTFQGSGIHIHLNPLGFGAAYQNNGSNSIVTTGKEPYITMWKANAIGGGAEGRYIKFKVPIKQFYVDADHPAGGGAGYFLTFGGTDDIHSMNVMQTSNT